MSELANEIREKLSHRRKWAGRDFLLAQSFSWLGVLSGAIAGATVLAGKLGGTVLGAVLAAIPGFLLLVRDRFQFDERGAWNDEYAVRLEALLHDLSYRGVSEKEVSRRLDALQLAMGKTFPGAGRLPVDRTSNSAAAPGIQDPAARAP